MDTQAAWELLLHHPSAQLQSVVCCLSCVSKTPRDAVARCPAGTVAVSFTGKNTTSFVAWIRVHSRLVKTISLTPAHSIQIEAQTAIITALQQANAAAEPLGLLLQSYDDASTALAPGVLQALPQQHLTSLNIPWGADLTGASPAAMHALAQLTALRSLQLLQHTPSAYAQRPDASPILPSLAQLTCLTAFTMQGVAVNGAALQHLPVQLQSLQLHNMVVRTDNSAPALSHLSALTLLHAGSMGTSQSDVLPASLRSLCLGSCSSLRPLAPLQQLEWLEMEGSEFSGFKLRRMAAALPGLTTLHLIYNEQFEASGDSDWDDDDVRWDRDLEPEDSVAAAWGALPSLQRLDTTAWFVKPPQLSLLQNVTCFVYRSYDEQFEESGVEFAAGLSQMRSLRALTVEPSGDWWDGKQGTKAVCKAVAGMRQLRSLEWDLPLGSAAAKHLANAKQLVSLDLGSACNPSDVELITLCLGLTRLTRLVVKIDDDYLGGRFTPSVLPFVARLPRLSSVCLESPEPSRDYKDILATFGATAEQLQSSVFVDSVVQLRQEAGDVSSADSSSDTDGAESDG